MKKNLSKASLELIEKAAQTQNKSIEELLVMEVPEFSSPMILSIATKKLTATRRALK